MPGFKAGGPIRSVSNIVNALKNEFEIYILTSAYDLGEDEPYKDVEYNLWHDQDGVFIKYLTKKLLNSSAISSNIKEVAPNVIYLNSLFSRVFTLMPLAVARKNKIKVILAPRGMLGQGALALKKSKKMSFIKMAKLLGWYKKVTWHASTPIEAKEIREIFGKKTKIIVAQNIPISQQLELENILDRKNTGKVNFVFLSRIAKKKNLHLAIEAFRSVKTKQEVSFDIYGNIEDDDYYNTFKDKIKKYKNITINYKGIANPHEIADIYANADFMLLPTSHENYGHSIVEAWANGCPVIISKNTPWKNLRVQDLGWDVDISDIKHITKAVQEGIDLDFTSYIQMVRASYLYFQNNICDEEIIDANRKLFTDEN
jgi:glycosyltransferase involved in cell wall biosynthesis